MVMMFAFSSSAEVTLGFSATGERCSCAPAAARTGGEVMRLWIVARSRSWVVASVEASVDDDDVGVTMI